ncbi:hypothetical protein BU17DRAFT_52783 [Hysterangium stoloniferum]|nr:hypothetical protein BU17DRAFT_52783 [Hysterangium stoloniferum]
MSSATGRKKSIVGVNGISTIDVPQQNNTLLNKSASQSTSLYQQCSQLRARLMSIRDFQPFLDLVLPQDDLRKSTDMVHDLWEHLQLGVPLVFLFNLLPPPAIPIESINTDPNSIDMGLMGRKDPAARRSRQRPIAQVSMAIARLQKEGHWKADLNFTVGDLLENNTNGFVKVVQALTYLVDRLPPDVFTEQPSPASPTSNTSQISFHSTPSSDHELPQEVERKNIIREMLETERKYVQDLEVMQTYSTALQQNNIIDQDTIHHLFPGLLRLLDFQRRFLISMEQTAEHPWKEQAWGKLFTSNEEEFEVYEPYCANYTNATELLLAEEQNLMSLADVINPKSELPAFLIKPVQRICKYPLLLDSLLRKSSRADYPLYDDLAEGSVAAKRVTDRINEAQRRAENIQTVKALQSRVEDWKGHQLSNFGDLLLDDIFLVTKSEVDRDYHVFLFEKIILCCKEAIVIPSKKVSKNGSILKKQPTPNTALPGGSGLNKKKNTPLLLKGRIFLNNVTSARRVPAIGDPHALRVFWRGEDDAEYFTLRCRSEEQLKQWENAIMRLVGLSGSRRQSERQDRIGTPNSTNPALALRHSAAGYHHEKSLSVHMQTPAYPGTGTAARFPGYRTEAWHNGNGSEIKIPIHHQAYPSSTTNPMYPNIVKHPYGGDNLDDAETEYNEYSARPQSSSGRRTPLGGRRAGDSHSMPPERDPAPGYDRPRAKTEVLNSAVMQQWRHDDHPVPPPHFVSSPLPPPPGALVTRPSLSSRNTSDPGYSPGVIPAITRPALRSKFSTTRLRDAYDEEQQRQQQQPPPFSRTGSQASVMSGNGLNGTRARSSSTPSQYNGPKPLPPPLPTTSQWGNAPKTGERNRGSASSQSTGESSDYSPPRTGSPITSFGSVDFSVTPNTHSTGLRSTRSQVFTGQKENMLVKVRYGEDLFTLDVPRSIDYDDLVANVGHKVRRCGPRRTPGPLRIKYQDEDSDLVSLSTTEDVQLAFDMAGGTLTLYVQ